MVAAAAAALGVTAAPAFSSQSPNVTICHAPAAPGNPYNAITIDASALKAHVDHSTDKNNNVLPVYAPGMNNGEWGDVIPPDATRAEYPAGLNWSAEGQAIWNRVDANGAHTCAYVGPSLSLTKTPASQTFQAPQTGIHWTVTVTNATSADVTTAPIIVSDTLPAGLTNGTITGPAGWTCVNATMTCTSNTGPPKTVLAPGASAAFTVTADGPLAAIPAGANHVTLTNHALATTTGSPNATAHADVTLTVPPAQPAALVLSSTCQTRNGNNTGAVDWSVTNPSGNGPLTNVTYASTPAGKSGTLATVAAGDTRVFTTDFFSGTLTVAGTALNQAATSNAAATPASCPAGQPTPTVVITIAKTWLDTSGHPVTGNPPSTNNVTATYGNQSVHQGATLTVPVGDTYTVSENVPAGWHNVSGLGNVVAPAGNTTHTVVNQLDGTAALGLVKSVDVGDGTIVQPGEDLNYTLTYSNHGTATATGVVVTDVLPDGATFVSIADGGAYDVPTTTASWTVASIAPGGSGTVHWTVSVNDGLPKGSAIVNVGSIDDVESNQVTNPVATGDLTLGKAVDKRDAEFGDSLTYTLTAKATGNQDQTGVVITDKVPDGTTYESATCASPCTATLKGSTVTWTVGDLAAGESVAVSFTVTIDTPPARPDGGIAAVTIVNVGSIRSDSVDPIPSNTVRTPITAVLGERESRNPPKTGPENLPFTGAPISDITRLAVGLLMIGGVALAIGRRRRDDQL